MAPPGGWTVPPGMTPEPGPTYPGGPPPPPAGTTPPPWGDPGARSPGAPWPPTVERSKNRVIGTAVLAAVVAFLVGLGILVLVVPAPDPYPDQWDPRVEEYVAFVERTTGERFEHPVDVEFLTEEAFVADITGAEEPEPSAEDRADADRYEGILRALGVVEGDVDLLADSETVLGESTAAYYDAEDRRIRVRGTELTQPVEVTLVHELTHALQDQVVDLGRLDDLESDEEASAFRAVVEGHASVVEQAWIEQLDDDERAAYDEELAAQVEEVDTEGVPDVLVAQFSAPYLLGAPFVGIIEERDGPDAAWDVLRDPPANEDQLLDPGRYVEADAAEEVDPSPPDGEVLEEGGWGALAWYLVLAERIDVHDALAAVDGWGGDSYALYERDGVPCVQLAVTGDTATATDRLQDALTSWSEGLPGVALERARDANGVDVVTVDACDPGPDASVEVEGRAQEALQLPSARLYVWMGALTAGLSDAEARCLAEAFTAELTMEDLAAEEPDVDRVQQLYAEADASCR